MAEQIPIKVLKTGGGDTCGLAQFSSTDSLAVSVGGTGITTQGICAFAQPGINAVACETTYIGICAGKSEGAAKFNTYVGYAAGQNVTTGCTHTIMGANAGAAITTCSSLVLIGYNAGRNITFGVFNTLIGTSAGAAVITASNNTGLGYHTLNNTICSNNVAVGTCAMVANTQGQDNVAIGLKAGATQVAAGCNNVFIGSCVGAVALCRDNTLVGAHAGIAQTTASSNVFLGVCVGYGVVGGGSNVYLGDKTGLVNTSGNHNIFIGNCAGVASTASCCLIIGNGGCDIITGSFATPLVSMVGCVGIGTAAPNREVQIQGNLRLQTAVVGENVIIDLNEDSKTKAAMGYSHNDNAFTISHLEAGSAGVGTAQFVIKEGNVGIGTATPNESLTLEAGVVSIKEVATPTATTNYGKVYTKTDNKLYFQDGAGTEHELAFA